MNRDVCEHFNPVDLPCDKCKPGPMQEPVAWRWGYRSITTGEMDWRGYVEIAADPNLRSPAIIMQPLYTAPFPLEAERNFCPRCGKRTNDIHTCTPPDDPA